MTHTPLHMIWEGHEAVVFFFVLSGFVLALPYVKGKGPIYRQYLIRRFCRIYLPFAVIAAISVFLLGMNFCNRRIPIISPEINAMWSEPIFVKQAADIFLMLGDMHWVVPSAWSLVHELRISLVFPFIALAIIRLGWRESFVLGLFLAVLGGALIYFNFAMLWKINETIFYSSLFVWGALLAKNRAKVAVEMEKLKGWWKIGAVLAALVLYNFRWLVGDTEFISFKNVFVADPVIGVGSILFIAMALGWNGFKRFLEFPLFLWLGRISYSLYLIHPFVLLMSVYYLWPHFYFVKSVIAGFILSIIFAALFNQWVERPSINLGRRISENITATRG